MLHDVECGGKVVNTVWFLQKYVTWCRALHRRFGPTALLQVKAAIMPKVHTGIITASWVHPGADWRNTPFQMLYDTLQDEQWAAQFLGLICCDCVLDHVQATGQQWWTKHCEYCGLPIRGRTYWEG